MNGAVRLTPLLLLALGVALVAFSVATGSAEVALFLVFPVVSGASATFLAGVLLLLASFVSMPFAWASTAAPESATSSERAGGGVILLGPVPIFFGDLGAAERSRYLRWVALGALLTVLAFVLALAWALGR